MTPGDLIPSLRLPVERVPGEPLPTPCVYGVAPDGVSVHRWHRANVMRRADADTLCGATLRYQWASWPAPDRERFMRPLYCAACFVHFDLEVALFRLQHENTKLAPDPRPGHRQPPSGTLTPSLIEACIRSTVEQTCRAIGEGDPDELGRLAIDRVAFGVGAAGETMNLSQLRRHLEAFR